MRAVVQRVTESSVTVDGAVVGRIGAGLMILLGVGPEDTPADAQALARKIFYLRIFEDADGKMNLGLGDTGGEVLAVSQFTLLADCRKGRRPSFVRAAPPEVAEPLYLDFVAALRRLGVKVETGRFGAMMQVALINDGPVTLVLETRPGPEALP